MSFGGFCLLWRNEMFEEFSGIKIKDTRLDPEYVYKETPRSKFLDAYRVIMETTVANPELKLLFEENLRDDGWKPAKRTKQTTGPMPLDPTAIQVSIWDNWSAETPRKYYRQRYGVDIKAWVGTEIDFQEHDWKGSATLMDAATLRLAAANAHDPNHKTMGKLNKNPISAEYEAMIMVACDTIEDTGLCGGMMVSKPHGSGTLRHDRQMVLADVAAIKVGDMATKLHILLDEVTLIKLSAWSTKVAGPSGRPLGSKSDPKTGHITPCIMQSRWAADPTRFRGWVTG